MAIIVPIAGALGRRLERLRRRLDPLADETMPPHIPLVGPFRAEPPFLPLEQHCWRVCHESAPLWVELGPVSVDSDERIVYLELTSGHEQLLALREALLVGRYATPRDGAPYQPRADIARLEREDDLAAAEREAGDIPTPASLFLERIALMGQYPDGAWYERDFYTLDRAVTRA